MNFMAINRLYLNESLTFVFNIQMFLTPIKKKIIIKKLFIQTDIQACVYLF